MQNNNSQRFTPPAETSTETNAGREITCDPSHCKSQYNTAASQKIIRTSVLVCSRRCTPFSEFTGKIRRGETENESPHFKFTVPCRRRLLRRSKKRHRFPSKSIGLTAARPAGSGPGSPSPRRLWITRYFRLEKFMTSDLQIETAPMMGVSKPPERSQRFHVILLFIVRVGVTPRSESPLFRLEDRNASTPVRAQNQKPTDTLIWYRVESGASVCEA